jgi:hypothetical protein
MTEVTPCHRAVLSDDVRGSKVELAMAHFVGWFRFRIHSEASYLQATYKVFGLFTINYQCHCTNANAFYGYNNLFLFLWGSKLQAWEPVPYSGIPQNMRIDFLHPHPTPEIPEKKKTQDIGFTFVEIFIRRRQQQ